MPGPFHHPTRAADVLDSGRRAAADAARGQGLPTGDLRVLSARGNLVVHLAPAPVVARVSTLTALTRRDPAAWLRHELAAARHAVAGGADVVAPAPGVDPGPHLGGAHPVTLWTFVDVVRRRPTPAVAGAALAALHAAFDRADADRADADGAAPLDLPWLTPATDQVADALEHVARRGLLPHERLLALRRRHRRVLDDLAARPAEAGPDVVLHGDAHAGNLLRVGDRWCWTDLEEACRGPVAWDLAVLAASCGEHGGRQALAAWSEAAGRPAPGPGTLAPFAAARRLEAAVWLVGMADADPGRYARLVPDALVRALDEG